MNGTIELARRRTRRSDNPLTATRYQLDQAVEDFNLSGALIATDDGLLFATSEGLDEEEALWQAALAPATLRGESPVLAMVAHRVAQVVSIEAYGQALLLVLLGDEAADLAGAKARISAGTRRISEERRAA